jgi:hypothetical protein
MSNIIDLDRPNAAGVTTATGGTGWARGERSTPSPKCPGFSRCRSAAPRTCSLRRHSWPQARRALGHPQACLPHLARYLGRGAGRQRGPPLMGFVRKTPAGTYRACWRDPAGKQRSKSFPTKREASRFLAGSSPPRTADSTSTRTPAGSNLGSTSPHGCLVETWSGLRWRPAHPSSALMCSRAGERSRWARSIIRRCSSGSLS